MGIKDRILEMLIRYHWPNPLSPKTYLFMAATQAGLLLLASVHWLFNDERDLLSPLMTTCLILLFCNSIGAFLFKYLGKITLFRLIPHLTYLAIIGELTYYTAATLDRTYLYTVPYVLGIGAIYCIGQFIFQMIVLKRIKQKNGMNEKEMLIDIPTQLGERQHAFSEDMNKMFWPFAILCIATFIAMTIGYITRKSDYFLMVISMNFVVILVMGTFVPTSFHQAIDYLYQLRVSHAPQQSDVQEDKPRYGSSLNLLKKDKQEK